MSVQFHGLLRFLPKIRAGFEALDARNADSGEHPQDYPEELFQVLAYQRTSFYTPYRQLEGVAKLLCSLLTKQALDYTTIFRRCQDVTLDALLDLPDLEENTSSAGTKQPETHCFDATGLKISGAGEWLQKVHNPGTRKVWLKFHADAICPTHAIRVHILTGSDIGDAIYAPRSQD